jgi:hypothetical protein
MLLPWMRRNLGILRSFLLHSKRFYNRTFQFFNLIFSNAIGSRVPREKKNLYPLPLERERGEGKGSYETHLREVTAKGIRQRRKAKGENRADSTSLFAPSRFSSDFYAHLFPDDSAYISFRCRTSRPHCGPDLPFFFRFVCC